MVRWKERLGFSARMREIPFEVMVEEARKLGLNFIEVVADIPWGLPNGDKKDRWRRMKETTERFKLQPLLHASYIELNPSSPNALLREAAITQIKGCMELASFLGAAYMVVHPGNLNRNYPKSFLPHARSHLIQGLKELASEAQKMGLLLALENGWNGENHPIIRSSQDHIRIVEEVGSPALGILLDLGHANTFPEDLCVYIDRVGDMLLGFHVHDNNGRVDQHLPLGRGTLPKEAINRAMCLPVPKVIEMNCLDDLKESLRALERISSGK